MASTEDLAQARAALALIHARGFHRGRDLPRLLAAAIDELGKSIP